MNIQAMLDRRMETLKQESRDRIAAGPLNFTTSPVSAKNDKVATIAAGNAVATRDQGQPDNAAVAGSGAVVDQALAELARRVFNLTEQVGVDLARWEREMLASKLAILQKAEAALDLALALKQRPTATAPTDAAAPVASLAARRDAARTED